MSWISTVLAELLPELSKATIVNVFVPFWVAYTNADHRGRIHVVHRRAPAQPPLAVRDREPLQVARRRRRGRVVGGRRRERDGVARGRVARVVAR
jgi:hypothetical protein